MLIPGMLRAQASILIQGRYRGERIILENPSSELSGGPCIDSIKINGKIYQTDYRLSVIEIDFKGENLTSDDEVYMVVHHRKDCRPKVIHDSFHYRRSVRFSSVEITASANLSWQAESDKKAYEIIVEQYRWNRWIELDRLPAQTDKVNYQYNVSTYLTSGENKFRLKHVDRDGMPSYSRGALISGRKEEIEYTLDKEKKLIEFSHQTLYEVYDREGTIILDGNAAQVDLSSLPKGNYYLNHDNQTNFIRLK